MLASFFHTGHHRLLIWAALNIEVLRADEGEASRIVQHDLRMRKSGSDPRIESNPLRLGGKRPHSVVAKSAKRVETQMRERRRSTESNLTIRFEDYVLMANRVKSPAGPLPNSDMWETWRTMPLFCGFSRGSPVSPALVFRRYYILTSISLIGSQDLAVKSCPNFFTHSHSNREIEQISRQYVADAATRNAAGRRLDSQQTSQRSEFLVSPLVGATITMQGSTIAKFKKKCHNISVNLEMADLPVALSVGGPKIFAAGGEGGGRLWVRITVKVWVLIELLVHTVFDTSWRTLAQSSPSAVTADNQSAVNVCIFVRSLPILTTHCLSASTVEGGVWASVLQEVANTAWTNDSNYRRNRRARFGTNIADSGTKRQLQTVNTGRQTKPMRVIRVSMEQCRNETAEETEDPRVNPPTSDIMWHDSHKRKSGSDPFASHALDDIKPITNLQVNEHRVPCYLVCAEIGASTNEQLTEARVHRGYHTDGTTLSEFDEYLQLCVSDVVTDSAERTSPLIFERDVFCLHQEELDGIVKELKNTKAPEQNEITSGIANSVYFSIRKDLLTLMNNFLHHGRFLNIWENRMLKMLYKGGNKDLNNAKSYRPPTSLPVLGKILEIVQEMSPLVNTRLCPMELLFFDSLLNFQLTEETKWEHKTEYILQQIKILDKVAKLEFSVKKTNAMLLKGRFRRSPTIILKGRQEKIKTIFKYIGLVLKSKLGFHDHIRYLTGKAVSIFIYMRAVSTSSWGLGIKIIITLNRSVSWQLHYTDLQCGTKKPRLAYTVFFYEERHFFMKTQGASLLVITRVYRATSTEALQGIAGIIPLVLLVIELGILMNETDGISSSSARKNDVRREMLDLWQERWAALEKRRTTYIIFPDIRNRVGHHWITTDYHLSLTFNRTWKFQRFIAAHSEEARHGADLAMCKEYEHLRKNDLGKEPGYVSGLNVSSTAMSLETVQVEQGRGIGEGLGRNRPWPLFGTIPAFTWNYFGKPWKTEIRMTGPGIEPGTSRLRAPPRLHHRYPFLIGALRGSLILSHKGKALRAAVHENPLPPTAKTETVPELSAHVPRVLLVHRALDNS
ncbi:hypothetical protein PR048_012148 [Dryococelus australis]|uniref:Uncharacterized protein n=1 Tax=Dryococelus australis TaxID=614101 RepID=A0ABQ9HNN9_9NEOP|nr:hypothetical protein PR048_012148 [Dryococelus australis]